MFVHVQGIAATHKVHDFFCRLLSWVFFFFQAFELSFFPTQVAVELGRAVNFLFPDFTQAPPKIINSSSLSIEILFKGSAYSMLHHTDMEPAMLLHIDNF